MGAVAVSLNALQDEGVTVLLGSPSLSDPLSATVPFKRGVVGHMLNEAAFIRGFFL